MNKKILLGLCAGMLLMGCRAAVPIQNVQHQALPVKDAKVVERAIIAGTMKRGWNVRKTGPQVFEAVLDHHALHATVEIPYGEDYYSIIYKQSANLKYNGKKEVIHPRYNTWILNLKRAINSSIIQ